MLKIALLFIAHLAAYVALAEYLFPGVPGVF